MLRIVIDEYLSQQVSEPSLIAKYSANSLLSWEEITQCYRLQQLATLFLGMLAESVPVECLISVTGLICNSRRSSWTPKPA